MVFAVSVRVQARAAPRPIPLATANQLPYPCLMNRFNPCTLSLVTALFLPACGHAPPPLPPVSPTESPALEQAAEQQAHASVPDGARAMATLHGVAAAPDQFTDWSVPLEAGHCYWFGFAADPGVETFSVYLWDPANHRAETARNRPREGVVQYCATTNGMYKLEGKVTGGAGHFAVVTYGKQVAAVAGPAPVRDLAQTIEAQAASAAPGAVRVGEFFSGASETSDWATSMDAGKCYWIIGAGEPGKVKKLYLYLWDPRNTRITESRSDSDTAMIGHCATAPGMYKFQAKVYSGSGPYKVGVYVK
jgi:hypothetical protein